MILLYVCLFIIACTDGALRLLNGTNSSGIVLICLDNAYGSICIDRWDNNDASVVCRQLNRGM